MGGGRHFVAMTTPMSLQPWWWQIFILIQLRSQFFQMFDYCDVVYTQTCYWPWKTVSSHLHMPGRPCCCNVALICFLLFRKNLGNLRDFLGKWFTAPPGKKFPVRLWPPVTVQWITSLILRRPISFAVPSAYRERPRTSENQASG